ncbi:hypothetical protein SOVF_201540, partial [Spinacia oleracea]
MQLVNGERFKEVTVRHGDVVDALRFVVAKPDGTTNTYQFGGNTGAVSKAPEIEIFGPYGSKLPQNYDQQLEDGERYKEITVTHGSIVDSLGFVVAKRDGSTATYQFGGKGAHVGKVSRSRRSPGPKEIGIPTKELNATPVMYG